MNALTPNEVAVVLTNNQVLEIFNSSLTNYQLAFKYKVSEVTIRKIKNGGNWSRITGKKQKSRRLFMQTEIATILKDQRTQTKIAIDYGVHQITISRIKRNPHLYETQNN